MKECYLKSLQMIKECKIKNEKEYSKLLKNYLLLSIPSLEYMSGKIFEEIIEECTEI